MKMNYDHMLKLAADMQPDFKRFYLSGGTAIMFKYHHRQSLDLDFFSERAFSYQRLAVKVRKLYPVENEIRLEDNIDFVVEGIKVSFVFFPFKNIKPVETIYNIRIASDYDLFLNKIYVAGRRIDPKDPLDAAFLYEKHGWNKPQIKRDFERKFPDQSYEIYLGALLNFEDYPDLTTNSQKILRELL